MKISLINVFEFSSWREFQDWIVDLFTPQLEMDYFGGRARHADAATVLKLVGSSIQNILQIIIKYHFCTL